MCLVGVLKRTSLSIELRAFEGGVGSRKSLPTQRDSRNRVTVRVAHQKSLATRSSATPFRSERRPHESDESPFPTFAEPCPCRRMLNHFTTELNGVPRGTLATTGKNECANAEPFFLRPQRRRSVAVRELPPRCHIYLNGQGTFAHGRRHISHAR